jgi:hypothetical protein
LRQSGIQIQEGVHADSPLLIAEATGAAEKVELDKANRVGDIGFVLHLLDDAKLVESAKQAIEAAVTGLSLALPTAEFREIEALGSVSYLVEPQSKQIPAHRGQSFRRIGDSNPVIADSF